MFSFLFLLRYSFYLEKCQLLIADTCNNMDKQRNYVEQMKSGTKEHIVYQHFYEVQEVEKMIYSDICF